MRKRLLFGFVLFFAFAGLAFGEGDYYNQKYGGGSSGSAGTGSGNAGSGNTGGTGGGSGSGGTGATGTGTGGSGSAGGGSASGTGESSSTNNGAAGSDASTNAGEEKDENGHYANDNDHQSQVDSVKNAADAGDVAMGYVSNAALIESYNSGQLTPEQKDRVKNEMDKRGLDPGSNADNAGGGNGNGELSEEGKNEISEAEKAAREAEAAAIEALKEFTTQQEETLKTENEIRKKTKELDAETNKGEEASSEKIDKLNAELEQLYDDWTNSVKKEEKLQSEANEKIDEMSKAYNELADTYEKYGITGDPVAIDSGTYIASYLDFEAQDFLQKFSIIRNHSNNNANESFGKNWTCPLDSRIVKCCIEPQPDIEKLCDQVNQQLQKEIDILTKYQKKYSKFPNDEIADNLALSAAKKDFYEKLKNFYRDLQNRHNQTEDLNKFVLYGRYSSWEDHTSHCNKIIYLDHNGQEFQCYADTQGVWIPLGRIDSAKFKIYPFNSGYQVVYENGTKKNYDKYGILTGEIDRNNNVVSYQSYNGRINSVTLKTGEKLTISRNSQNQITSISGPVSGSTQYSYTNNRIKSVTDNKGIFISYEYDDEGNLTKINKADGTAVRISYTYDNVKKKNVCTSVTNERGIPENFIYDFNNGVVKHKTPGGFIEEFHLNSQNETVYYNDGHGRTVSITPDSRGLIQSIRENGITRTYTYNKNFHPEKVVWSDGGTETMTYSQFGQLSSLTDKDGFSTRYSFDSAGNITGIYYCGTLVTSIAYYNNGLVKTLSEAGNTYSYQYNSYGNITSKICRTLDGKSYSETWNYDSKNRPVKYKGKDGRIVTISYSSNQPLCTRTEQYDNKKQIITSFDSRGRVSEHREKDTATNKSFSIRYKYDGHGNVTQVLLDNQPYMEFTYTSQGFLDTYTIWNMTGAESHIEKQSVKISYTYDNVGRVTSKTMSSIENTSIEVERYTYSTNSGGSSVTVYCGNQIAATLFYDNYGRLIKEVRNNEYTKNYVYSKAGRLISTTDSNNLVSNYTYKNDGSVVVTKSRNSKNPVYYTYDSLGHLVSCKDNWNLFYEASYDFSGNLKQERRQNKQILYTYDNIGRCISKEIKNNKNQREYIQTNLYDDQLLTRKTYEGGVLVSEIKYDAWNRIIGETTGNGSYSYEYDWFGNITKKSDQHGNSIIYEYSPYGKPVYKKDADSKVTMAKYLPTGRLSEMSVDGKTILSAKYDSSGRISDFTDSKNNKTHFDYNGFSFPTSISFYDTGRVDFIPQIQNKKIVIKNSNGGELIYELDSNGNIKREIDAVGNQINYSYDNQNRVINKIYGSGLEEKYSYSENITEVNYSNGQWSKVEKNSLNQIVKMENNSGAFIYKYDEGGRLTQLWDEKHKLSIDYKYDSWGRLQQKKSENFDYVYEYNNKGQVTKLHDLLSNAWSSFTYDSSGRLVTQAYSNGLVKTLSYDSLNNITNFQVKNRSGQLLAEQQLLYNKDNKIAQVTNQNGQVWTYNYDSQGRLIRVTEPYTEETRQNALKEASECGAGIKNEKPAGILVNSQYSWYQEFEYTPGGSLASVTNPFGTILYEYDKMNRLTKKHSQNTQTGGIALEWNKDNCLVQIKSLQRELHFDYGANLRPETIIEKNMETWEQSITLFEYDALDRPVIQKDINGSKLFLYDGFSSAPVFQTMIAENGTLPVSANKTTEDSQNTSYKWINDEAYVPYVETRGLEVKNGKTGSEIKTTADLDSRPASIMYFAGEPLAFLYNQGQSSEKEIEYYISDCFGTSIGAFASNGDYSSMNVSDLWGQVIHQGKNGTYNYSTLTFGQNTNFYNLGLRFYIPDLKTFTTADPARNSSNWFAYCSADPINYTDETGFWKRNRTESQKARSKAILINEAKFDRYEAHYTGESQGIPNEYDCADVASQIQYIENQILGLESSSEMQKRFDEHSQSGDKSAAQNDVKSDNYFDSDMDDNVHKTGDKSDQQDPGVVTPGTVLAWRNDGSDWSKRGGDNWTGHVLVVLGVEYDANGNVTGFIYIEGHTSGDKTTLGYIATDGNSDYFSVDSWYGEFLGFFEVESAYGQESCGK